jgi:hypothetical protein
MELIIALALFIGMIVCWLVLPGTTTSMPAEVRIAERPEHGHTPLEQLA